MTEIPDWLNPTPGGTIGHPPDGLGLQQWNAPSEDELRHMRGQLLESVLSAVVQAVRGLFIPGPFGAALEQLVDWASNLPLIGPLVEAITGVVGGTLDTISDFFGGFIAEGGSIIEQLAETLTGIPGTLADIALWVSDLPLIGPLVEAITGIVGGGLSDITDFFSGLAGGVGTLLEQVVSVIAGAFTGIGGTIEDIIAWVETIPVIGPLVEAITGVVGGGLSDITDFFSTLLDGLWDAFTGDGSIGKTLGDVLGAITNGIGELVDRAVGWLPGLLGIGAVADTTPNLLLNPGFDTSISLSGQGVWAWDGTQDHTGKTGSGSAKVVADGGVKELLSNAISVVEGQQISGSGWARWSGLAAPGGSHPIEIALVGYLGDTPVATPYLARTTMGSATVGWTELAGAYTIPAGMDQVRFNCKVTSDATGGTVWFDDLELTKTNKIQQGWIESLLDDLGDRVGIGVFNDLLDVLGGTIGATLDNIIARIAGFLTGSSDLNGSKITFGSIIDSVIPGLGTLLGNIWAKLTGNEPEQAVSHTEVADALAQTANVLTGNSSDIAALQAVFTGGVSTGDDFERSASTMGSNWDYSYSNGSGHGFKVNGHELFWETALFDIDSTVALCRWVGLNATSQTDYQVGTIVLGSAPVNPLIGTSAANTILLRMNSAKTSYVAAQWKADNTVSLYRVVSGASTLMNSASCATPGAGASLMFQAGKPGTARYYKLAVNSSTVLEWTEAGADSMVGASYRGWGLGAYIGRNESGLSQSPPGRVRVWVGADL